VNLNRDCIKRELELQKSTKALENINIMSQKNSPEKNHISSSTLIKGPTHQVSQRKIDNSAITVNIKQNNEEINNGSPKKEFSLLNPQILSFGITSNKI
jgi:UDP-2,3-diacylglucosamine pyrophosphatase LpxH